MKKLSLYVFIFLLGVAVAQAVYYYPVMPEIMASHFGEEGLQDNSMGRFWFFIVHLIIILSVTGIFVVLPYFFQKYRVKKFSIPNKEYWTKPENLDEFYEFFRSAMGWFGVAELILMTGIMQLVFAANLQPKPVLNLNAAFLLLISFFIFVVFWLVAFFIKARNTH